MLVVLGIWSSQSFRLSGHPRQSFRLSGRPRQSFRLSGHPRKSFLAFWLSQTVISGFLVVPDSHPAFWSSQTVIPAFWSSQTVIPAFWSSQTVIPSFWSSQTRLSSRPRQSFQLSGHPRQSFRPLGSFGLANTTYPPTETYISLWIACSTLPIVIEFAYEFWCTELKRKYVYRRWHVEHNGPQTTTYNIWHLPTPLIPISHCLWYNDLLTLFVCYLFYSLIKYIIETVPVIM